MNRSGLLIALGIATVTGLAFGLYPQLDVAISRWFYLSGTGFAWSQNAALDALRDVGTAIIALLVAPAVVALFVKLFRPRRRMFMPGRAAVLMVSTLILGPLLVTNLLLKEHWGRPRPREIVQLGGSQNFVPWWDPRGACTENCSFVAGEPAGAAWTLAPAALAPPQWRAVAYAGALAFTGAVGLLRIGFGGHFFSDVVFAGVLTFCIIWLAHGLLYRWRTRTTDVMIEQALERVAAMLRRPFSRDRDRPPDQNAAGPSSESYSSLQKEPP
jgi:lipid A 4'-phosphatase